LLGPFEFGDENDDFEVPTSLKVLTSQEIGTVFSSRNPKRGKIYGKYCVLCWSELDM